MGGDGLIALLVYGWWTGRDGRCSIRYSVARPVAIAECLKACVHWLVCRCVR